MTFEEASKKGKFIKRPIHYEFMPVGKIVEHGEIWCVPPDAIWITNEDIKANDWEARKD